MKRLKSGKKGDNFREKNDDYILIPKKLTF